MQNKNKLILIVDDKSLVNFSCLDDFGFQRLVVDNVAIARQIVLSPSAPLALVILDPAIENRSGHRFFSELVELKIPVIVQSEGVDFSTMLYAGAIDYFVKPYKTTVATKSVLRWLDVLQKIRNQNRTLSDLFYARKKYIQNKIKPKIALIEDSLDDALSMSAAYSDTFEIAWCPKIEDMLERIEQGQEYDMVILDLYFDGSRKGFDFLNECKTNRKLADIPLVIMSSHFSQTTMTVAYDLGATDYIEKGVSTRVAGVDSIAHRLMTHIADSKILAGKPL